MMINEKIFEQRRKYRYNSMKQETRNPLPGTRNIEEFKFDFENLKVYQKSLDFIDRVFEIYRCLDQGYKISLGSNLLRAALSVANNIAEGNDKKSAREKCRYMTISSDSARECVSVINVLNRQDMIDSKVYQKLRNDVREITSMLRGLITSSSP